MNLRNCLVVILYLIIATNSNSVHAQSVFSDTILSYGICRTHENGFVIVPPHPAPNVTLKQSTKFSVTACGIPVPARNASNTTDAWFFFCGQVEIKVTFHQNISAYQISPKSLPADINVAGNVITLKLDSPRKFIIFDVNGEKESLSIFADSPPEDMPEIGASNVIDVTSYISKEKLVQISSATTHEQLTGLDVSAEIQQAISNLGHGSVLFFPVGLYPVTSLKLKSNMEFYLSPGSIIYSIHGSRNLNGVVKYLLEINNLSNVTLRGHGTFMANGHIYSGGGDDGVSRQQTFYISGNNIILKDFLIREQQHWSLQLHTSQNMIVRNLKILTSIDGLNRDGIGIASGQNMILEDNYVHSGDDAMVIKSTTTDFNYNLLARNNVLWNQYSGGGIKIGTKFFAPGVRNMAFENNDIICAPRSLSFYFDNNEHYVQDVIYKNTRCEKTYARPGATNLLMDLKKGTVQNVRFVNFHVMHNSKCEITTTKSIDLLFNGFYRYPNGISQPPVKVLSKETAMPSTGVRFTDNQYTVISVKSMIPAVTVPGTYEVFKIHRTGNLSASLSIPCTIRTTAEAGKDFVALSGEAILKTNEAETTISIEFLPEAFIGSNKSLLIVPDYIPNDYVMMGPDFHACVAMLNKNVVGIREVSDATEKARLYPNPTQGCFEIELPRDYTNILLSITNPFGQELLTKHYSIARQIEVELNNYPKGIYFVNLVSSESKITNVLILN